MSTGWPDRFQGKKPKVQLEGARFGHQRYTWYLMVGGK